VLQHSTEAEVFLVTAIDDDDDDDDDNNNNNNNNNIAVTSIVLCMYIKTCLAGKFLWS
jgi:hypothetical protein